jgi:hypothetical protein
LLAITTAYRQDTDCWLTSAWTSRASSNYLYKAILINLVLNVVINRTLKLNSSSKGGIVRILASLDRFDELLELDRFLQRLRFYLL